MCCAVYNLILITFVAGPGAGPTVVPYEPNRYWSLEHCKKAGDAFVGGNQLKYDYRCVPIVFDD